ncbi:multiheme c-type cytochrome [Thaumasiovibrio subtropicus]|uniref:multiheme c-type cytochrome n=1 Tax=Thaumasiovibrio subtropicus TaxID=1891207 RepID=UPI000B353B3B|nr:multiheme c-type cytochrome [Thaumasiovibrio subtropicus]
MFLNMLPHSLIRRICYFSLLILLFSGAGIWFITTYAPSPFYLAIAQLFMLLHLASAALFLPLCGVYLWQHIAKNTGFRHRTLMLTGNVATLALIALMASGVYLALQGQTRATQWIVTSHQIAALTFFSVCSVHVIAWQQQPKSQVHLPKRDTVVFLLLLLVPLFATLRFSPEPLPMQPLPNDYSYQYSENPFFPAATTTPGQQLLPHNAIGDSENCATCHQDIAMQWRSSAHRLAAQDPSYVTNITLLHSRKGIEATRYCEGCHAPIALLTGSLTPGGNHGGIANTPANNEGVTCLACHNIERVNDVKGNGSYHVTPHIPYFFDASITSLNHLLIRTQPQQHKANFARSPLGEPALCATCHAQFMDEEMNQWGWVKMQDEYSGWLASPYSGTHNAPFNAQQTRCQDCHMPLVKAQDPSANDQGLVRSHRFLGANTMLPLLYEDEEQLAETIAFLQQDKMRIHIEPPHRQDAVTSQQTLSHDVRAQHDLPHYAYLNETISIDVIVSNIGVGHQFPGGTADINQAWIAITATDMVGHPLLTSGQLDEQGVVDPESYFYHSKPINRHGELVWQHDLFNMTGHTEKNVIPSGKSDTATFELTIPSTTIGPVTITATLRYRKFNQRYAKWSLGAHYQPLPIVDMATTSLVLPIRERSEANSGKER